MPEIFHYLLKPRKVLLNTNLSKNITELVSIGFLFIACGSASDYMNYRTHPRGDTDPRTFREIDPAFSSFVDTFYQECGLTRETEIPMGFVTTNFPVLAFCSVWESGVREVSIDKAGWFASTEVQKEWLIFHELGHCVLSREHNNVVNDVGVPASIMNSYRPEDLEDYYLEERTEYIKELCLDLHLIQNEFSHK